MMTFKYRNLPAGSRTGLRFIADTFKKQLSTHNNNASNTWTRHNHQVRKLGASNSIIRFSSHSSNDNIVKSPYTDVKEIDGITVSEIVWSLAGNHGDAIALECPITGYKLSHNEVYKQSRSFAAALLKSKDLKRGDKIAIVLPNTPQYAPVLYGIWDAGCIASPINPEYTPDEMERQIKNSESKCVVVASNFLPVIQNASIPNVKSIIVIGENIPAGYHSYYEMIKTDTTGVNFLKGSDINTREHLALLPYSSGTTGLPKGVMITHANLATLLLQLNSPGTLSMEKFESGREQERCVGLIPFFHCYGMTTFLMQSIVAGAHAMCVPKFQPELFVKIMKTHRPTILHLVTPLIAFIADNPVCTKKELESLHTVVGSAAPIGVNLIKKFIGKAEKDILFQEVYGMTELSPAGTILPKHLGYGLRKIGSCGVPIANTYMKIVSLDDPNKNLGPNERGELCFKGPQVMKGYWKNEEATKHTIKDGWLHTGDIAYYDNDKCVYIVDRLKELIKVKGFQVAPAELEELLHSHPAVADAAVIGISHPEWNEIPRAYIVLKPGSESGKVTENDIISFVKEKVAHYKQLKGGVEFIQTIPKAPSGKILRRELVKMYETNNNKA